MIKVLFLIHDLGQGGAEKVLVNLVNNMDQTKFDITVIALFGGGVNEQFLAPHITYKIIFPKAFPGNSHVMKLFTPKQLHKMCVKEKYDIEISYLEGPSVRIISGCENQTTKKVCWIHSTLKDDYELSKSFRNIIEAKKCYGKMDCIVSVSQDVQTTFLKSSSYQGKANVLYNTLESEKIIQLSQEEVDNFTEDCFHLIAVGSLKEVKGFDRLLRIIKKLKEDNLYFHFHLLGIGPLENSFKQYIHENHLNEVVTLHGYQTNPYKFISKCDLYVCSSYSEGFSTAATEALIVGTPVCTVEVSGMKEMLGENNEYGLVVDNNEEALYQGIKKLISDKELLNHYKQKAIERGKDFSTVETVKAVEKMLHLMG